MDLTYLASLTPLQFETERCRLINEELSKLDPERRKAALVMQMRIDQERVGRTPQEHLTALGAEMQENLLNLSDQFTALRNTLVPR